MILIDANILLYAIGRDDERRAACARLLDRAITGELRATINVEVAQEILHVLSRRGERGRALAYTAALLESFPDMLSISAAHIAEARRLLEVHPGLGVRDALHAASVLVDALDGIVSYDSAFDGVSGVRRVQPPEA